MLTKIKCELICYTHNAEELITKINKFCDIEDKMQIEHTNFTFAVEGISTSCTHQLLRYKLQTYSQQSQNDFNRAFSYITPNSIQDNPFINELFIQAMQNAFNSYIEISRKLLEHEVLNFAQSKGIPIYNLTLNLIEELIKTNYSKQYTAMINKSIEEAKTVLPNACETKIVFTMNAKDLINFFDDTHCNKVSQEIRQISSLMLSQVREVAPTLFKYAGASSYIEDFITVR